MDPIKGLTIEEAVKQGKLIPIDTSDPNWTTKLKEWVMNPSSIPLPPKQITTI
jgi:hypothetical protein